MIIAVPGTDFSVRTWDQCYLYLPRIFQNIKNTLKCFEKGRGMLREDKSTYIKSMFNNTSQIVVALFSFSSLLLHEENKGKSHFSIFIFYQST